MTPIGFAGLLVFAVIVFGFLIVALQTERAYYGQFLRYIERSERPILYWLVVVFTASIFGVSAWAAIETLFSSN